MNLNPPITKCFIKKKLATVALLTMSLVAFATLGDGGKKESRNFGSNHLAYSSKNFSIKSQFNYRSSNLLAQPANNQFITLNSTAIFQKGNTTYVLPLKRKPVLDKIRFNPARR